MKSLRTLSLTTFILCTILFAPSWSKNSKSRSSSSGSDDAGFVPGITHCSGSPYARGEGYRTGSVCGGFELTLKGNCFASKDPSKFFGRTSDDNGQGSSCDRSDSRTGIGNTVFYVPQSSGRFERKTKLSFYLSNGKKCNCGSECEITYSWSATPTMEAIIPMAANVGDDVNFYGIQRVSSGNDIKFIKIGTANCAIDNDPNPLSFDPNARSYVPCTTPATNTPGFYNVSQTNLKYTGNAWVFDTVHNYKLSKKNYYDFAVIPKIISINNKAAANTVIQGSIYGQIITIQGAGFSTTGNEVNVMDAPCVILSQSTTSIRCEVQEKSSVTFSDITKTPFHSGLRLEYFNGATNHKSLSTASSSSSRLDAEIYGNSGTYVAKLSGWFLAPTGGNYKFTLSGDQNTFFYFNDVPETNTVSLAETTAEIVGASTPFRFPWVNASKTVSTRTLQLTANKLYYFEAYSENTGLENFAIGVRIPNLGSSNSIRNSVNTVPEVQKIEANCNFKLSTLSFDTVSPDGSGVFFIVLTYKRAGSFNYDMVANRFNFGASNTTIAAGIKNKDGNVIPCTVSVTRAGNTISYTINFLALTYAWDITASSSFGSTSRGLGRNGACRNIQLSSESPALQGSVQVKNPASNLNAQTFQVTDSAETFANALRLFGYSPLIRVAKIDSADFQHTWVAAFYGDKGDIQPVPVRNLGLSGCSNNAQGASSINVGVWTIQDGSTQDAYYDVIPNHYLFTSHSVSQLTVQSTTNTNEKIKANCPSWNCGYTLTTNVPDVTSSSYNSGTKVLTLSVINVNFGSLTGTNWNRVAFGGADCTNVQFSYTSSTAGTITATCPLPAYGSHKPKVHLDGLGYSKVSAAAIPIGGSITSVSAGGDSSIPKNGGEVVIIEGVNLPATTEIARALGTTIKIGSADCELISSSPTQITCNLGPQADGYTGDETLVLSFGGSALTDGSLTLSSTAPHINTISPLKLNPVLQEYVTITGTNFDTTWETMQIFFTHTVTNEVKECDVKENSASATSITCFYLGMPTGRYEVTVLGEKGFSENSIFIDIGVQMDSVTPTSGSLGGGTEITISGGKFAQDITQTLVYIGPENWYALCDVISSTETAVKCITSEFIWDTVDGYTKELLVATRIQEEATGSISFTYDIDKTPEITTVSSNLLAPGDTVTFTGTKLGNTQTVKSSSGIVFTNVVATATQVTAVVPVGTDPVVNDNFIVWSNNGMGNAIFTGTASKVFSVSLTLDSISPLSGPANGVLLTLNGKGFHDKSVVTITPASGNSATCEFRNVNTDGTVYKCNARISGTVSVIDAKWTTPVTCTSGSCTVTLGGSSPSISSVTISGTTLAVQGSGFLAGDQSVRFVASDDNTVIYSFSGGANNLNTAISFNGIVLPAGKYNVEVSTGEALAFSNNWVAYKPSVVTGSTTSSVAGGKSVTVTGSAFSNVVAENSVTVCGLPAEVTASTTTSVTFITPTFVSALTETMYPSFVSVGTLHGYLTGDVQSQARRIYDNNERTSYTSGSTSCQIQLDLGTGAVAKLTEIRYMGTVGTDMSKLDGTLVQGSNDGSAWTTIYTLAATRDGFNFWSPSTWTTDFRYFRINGNGAAGKCNFAEFKFVGQLRSANSGDPTSGVACPAIVSTNGNAATNTYTVNYQTSATPVITSFSPLMGSSAGNYDLTITGTNLPTTPIIKIDGVTCDTTGYTQSSTQVQCKVAPAPSVDARVNVFDSYLQVASADGDAVSNGKSFLYVDNWSAYSTWNGIVPPREGDSVYIPAGQNILLDESPNILKALVIEGGLIIPDANINLQAKYIMINRGKLQVGTEEAPICTGFVNITLAGTRLDPSLPIAGNKMIANNLGLLDLHGCNVAIPWTTITATAGVGATSISTAVATNWKVGDKIFIASTEYDHNQAEERTITAISGTTITFTPSLSFSHFGAPQTFGSAYTNAYFSAEVGLLSRSVLVQGDWESQFNQHGVNIITFAQGYGIPTTRISNVEIFRCGQAYLVARYAVYFRLLGAAFDSYIKNSAIHESYNRAVSIHGTHYLRVQNNVAYKIMGHAMHLHDGVEQYNSFTGNLVASVRASRALLVTDLIPACFLITNPNNYFENNNCGGADGQGFWFNLPQNAGGACSSSYMCPQGARLGSFSNNVAHSNVQNGIRIFPEWIPRLNPCDDWVRWSDESDPFALNQYVQARLVNNKLWKNRLDGFQAEKFGAISLENTIALDNLRAGIEFADGRKAPTGTFGVKNVVIVGKSANGGSAKLCNRGLVLPRTDFFKADGVSFFNLNEDCTTAVETCSRCEYGPTSDSAGRTSYLKAVTFSSVSQKLKFNVPNRDIVVDEDGSFSGTAGNSITPSWPHLTVEATDPKHCPVNNAFNGIICPPSVKLRRVVFWGVGDIGALDMRLIRLIDLQDAQEPVLNKPQSRFSTIQYRYWRNPTGHWSFVAKAGDVYKYHWANGIDWSSLYLLRGDTFTTDAGDYVTLVHNHTAYREDFDVINYRTTGATLNVQNTTALWAWDASGDARTNADWHHDVEFQLLYIILKGGNNGTYFIKPYGCRINCVVPVTYTGGSQLETRTRYWCNPGDWQKGRVPLDDEDVVIEYTWNMILDCTTAYVRTITIKGTLTWGYFSDRVDNVFEMRAEAIWVQGGFFIGSQGAPHPVKASIVLQGDREAAYLSFGYHLEDLNKAIAVTGKFAAYGQEVTNYDSTLRYTIVGKTTGLAGKTITLNDAVEGQWKAGDEILLGASINQGETEVFSIVSVSGDTLVLNATVQHTHYGAAAPLSFAAGNIDMRTKVALLTRSIVITSTRDDNWGCRVYVTQWNGPNYQIRGQAILSSVAIERCGQANTTYGALEFDSLYKNDANLQSTVKNSVVRESFSHLMIATSSTKVSFIGNVFWKAWGSGVTFTGTFEEIIFQKNWVTDIRRASSNNPDFIYVHWDTNFRADGARFAPGCVLTTNTFSDCGGQCATIAGGDCSANLPGPWFYTSNAVYLGGNGVSVGGSTSTCVAASGWTVWGIAGHAISTASNAANVIVQNCLVADSAFGFSLNSGGQEYVTVTLKDSFLAGYVQDESYYTQFGVSCSGRVGIVASTTSTRSRGVPIWGPTYPWRRQFLEGSWSSIVHIDGNTFQNWDLSTVCADNYIVTNNEYAPNSQAIHLFSTSSKSNVHVNHTVFIRDYETSDTIIQRCGGWECTGYRNVLFKDTDGTLWADDNTGAVAFPRLDKVKQAYCTLLDKESGWKCKGLDWGILAFESLDNDRYTRIFSPVNITREDGFRNDINSMMMEDDNYPDNWVKLQRFFSIIQTVEAGDYTKNYTIQYLGSLPCKMRFQLQGANQATDRVVIRQRYDQPYIISLSHYANESVVRSSIKNPVTGVANFAGQGCGANYYFGVDQVVEFLLTGAEDCMLVATVTNGIKGRVRYAIDVNAFYANDGPTQFIDRVANVLGIDLSTVRVVSVVKGSTIVDFTVATQTQGIPSTDAQTQQVNSEIADTIAKLQAAINNGQLNILNSNILDSSFTGSSASNANNAGGSSPTSSGVDSKIIVIAAALGGLVLIIGAVIIVKRMSKKKEDGKVPGGFFDVKKAKSPRKIGTRVFPLPKDLQSPSEKAPVIVDLESMADTHGKVGTEMSQRKFLDSESASSPMNNQVINLEVPTKSRQQLKNPFE